MTSTSTAPTEGRIGRSGRPRPKRGEGQWALGYTEPLNKNEQSKKDDNPLNVRARILNIYSKRGFASIDPADLRGRFRWMGLYTQRAPGFDGGKTAMLEEEELDDEFFMLRVRSDGELLDAAKLRALGSIGTDFARGTADITDRQNIQFHWIEIENVPEIWQRLDDAGMTSIEACGDSPRPFLGSPVAGVAADEIIDATPALEEIKRRYIGNPEYSNLPRKFKTSASGHPSHDCVPRSTTSRSSARCTPSTARASTCGSAAASPPTRCWRRSSASGSRSRRCQTPGRQSPRSSATTATAGCARGRG